MTKEIQQKEKTVNVHLRHVSPDVHRELKAMAAYAGRSLEQYINNILTNYVVVKGGK